MAAYALALDWLTGGLTEDEESAVIESLLRLMNRWWPGDTTGTAAIGEDSGVNANRHSPRGGHHEALKNGHFRLAAIALLGLCPDAAEWVAAVVDKFRGAIMPHGCGNDGEPTDGVYFWSFENMWMLQ